MHKEAREVPSKARQGQAEARGVLPKRTATTSSAKASLRRCTANERGKAGTRCDGSKDHRRTPCINPAATPRALVRPFIPAGRIARACQLHSRERLLGFRTGARITQISPEAASCQCRSGRWGSKVSSVHRRARPAVPPITIALCIGTKQNKL
jgi:hypothetical protein